MDKKELLKLIIEIFNILQVSYETSQIISCKKYTIWLIFECARAKTARKSWDLLHRIYWVIPEIYIRRTSP
jgi:hypothetical protein